MERMLNFIDLEKDEEKSERIIEEEFTEGIDEELWSSFWETVDEVYTGRGSSTPTVQIWGDHDSLR